VPGKIIFVGGGRQLGQLGGGIGHTRSGKTMAADPKYLELLDFMKTLHLAKAAGYSGDSSDTWGNFREADNWGSSALQGCLIRLGDKYKRAQSVFQNPLHDQVGESLPKTLADMSAYCLIAIRLWEEINDPELRRLWMSEELGGSSDDPIAPLPTVGSLSRNIIETSGSGGNTSSGTATDQP
jgi:hypothetical protein